jgi:polysaccharide pyruvyl transferase WcaK-like protein
VLTGTFHSLNRGDSAMQLSAAQALRKRWPTAQIAIHCPYPADDRNLYKDFEVVPCSRRRPLAALRAVMQAFLWRLTSGRVSLSSELQSYRNATAVIDLSGDGLTETFGWKCPLSHTLPLLLAHLLRTPFCLMAQTIGPFRRFRPWFHWVFRRATFITARDDATFQYLSGRHLPCPVEYTADLAFLLEPASRDGAEQYLHSFDNYDSARPLIGITPSNLHNVKLAARASSAGACQEYLSALAPSVAAIAEDAGAQILIVPHVFGPGAVYDDRRAAESLAAFLAPTHIPLVVRDALSPAELKALIGCCDMFIGMRMHSVIAAISQAIPTLALAYSPKLPALMNRIGLGHFAKDCLPLSVEDVTRLGKQLWSTRSSVRGALEEKMKSDILPAADRNFDVLRRYVVGGISDT